MAKIVIMGDICPTEDYQTLFDSGNPQDLFGDVFPIIINSDYAVFNLECAVASNQKKATKCGPTLKAKRSDLEIIKKAGFQCASLANNHIKDYGSDGVLETIKSVENIGLSWFGVGTDDKHIKKLLVVEIDGLKIGFASFAEHEFNLATATEAGAFAFDPYTAYDYIKDWKSQCDRLIVLYHGGIEHYKYPTPLLQKKCRKMVSCGADFVLCQHSHCIGTKEDNIIYGQGNGIYGVRPGDDAWNEGLLVKLDIDDKSIKSTFHTLVATPNGIRLGEEKRIDQMFTDSDRIGDPTFVKEEWIKFCKKKAALNRSLLYGKSRIFNKINRIMGNGLFKLLYKKRAEMITMNLIRCDAWREVVTTILEDDIYGK